MSPNTQKKGYVTQKITVLKSLRTLNFLSYIPASPQIPPTTLLKEIKKYPLAMDYNRLFAVQSLLLSMSEAFKAETSSAFKFEHRYVFQDTINNLLVFSEINDIYEASSIGKDAEEFEFVRSNIGDTIKLVFVDSLQKLINDGFVFEKTYTYEDITGFIRNKTLIDEVKVSDEKIAIVYALVTLVDVIFSIELNNGILDDEVGELSSGVLEFIDRIGYLDESFVGLK